MKNNKNLMWVFPLFLFAVSSCYQAPEFPIEPNISFNKIRFYDVASDDSLVITINFQDGDGDLGIGGIGNEETNPPYHSHYYVTTDNRSVITPPANAKLLGPSSNDTMPPFNDCVDYRVGRFDNGNLILFSNTEKYKTIFPDPVNPEKALPPDTFYIKANVFAFNFLIDFMVKKGDKYEVFDWNKATTSGCADPVNGKFPALYQDGTLGNPLSGELSYTITNRGLIPYFRNDTLKLRLQIIDRGLHMSNIIETPSFYFVRPESTYQLQLLEE